MRLFKKGLLSAMFGHEKNMYKTGRQETHSDEIYNSTLAKYIAITTM
jgi:hypothetical protein